MQRQTNLELNKQIDSNLKSKNHECLKDIINIFKFFYLQINLEVIAKWRHLQQNDVTSAFSDVTVNLVLRSCDLIQTEVSSR